MAALNYRLVVLTHGDSATLPGCLVAFDRHVTPAPSQTVLVIDGDEPAPAALDFIHTRGGDSWWSPTGRPLGFCGATAYTWAVGAEPGVDYVFWLEHDFEVCRPVDLRDLRQVLDYHGGDGVEFVNLAQMALMRDAYSREERDAGGLFELRRADFVPMPPQDHLLIEYPTVWLKTPWFTTNPSLMRRDFMAQNLFPDDGGTHCEGRFGVRLAQEGWSFGTWGDGTVYCHHVGVRTGHGY